MNQFALIGPVRKVYSDTRGQYVYTCCEIETSRPGKQGQPPNKAIIPLRMFGNHIESRGLVPGVWVVATGRLWSWENQQGQIYAQVDCQDIQPIRTGDGSDTAESEPEPAPPARRPAYSPPPARPTSPPRQAAQPPTRQATASPDGSTPEERAGRATADAVRENFDRSRRQPAQTKLPINPDADDAPAIREDDIPF